MNNGEHKKTLPLKEYLDTSRILILHGKQEKTDVLNALIDRLAKVPEIGARDDIAWGIFHREGLMTTGIGNGIAVPHFPFSSIEDSYVALAVVPEGIADYPSLDHQIVRLVFMIICGKNQKTIHLHLIPEISRLFFDGRLKAAFLAAESPESCMSILERATKY